MANVLEMQPRKCECCSKTFYTASTSKLCEPCFVNTLPLHILGNKDFEELFKKILTDGANMRIVSDPNLHRTQVRTGDFLLYMSPDRYEELGKLNNAKLEGQRYMAERQKLADQAKLEAEHLRLKEEAAQKASDFNGD